jgi:hypothetical protein
VVSTKILVIVHKVCGRKFGKGMAARQGTALTLIAFFFSGEGGIFSNTASLHIFWLGDYNGMKPD